MEGGGVKLVFVVVVYLDCDEVVGAGIGDDGAAFGGGYVGGMWGGCGVCAHGIKARVIGRSGLVCGLILLRWSHW